MRRSVRFSITEKDKYTLANRRNWQALTELYGEVLRLDILNVLVGDGVSERLKLLGWAAIVFQHHEEGLCAGKRPLASLATAGRDATPVVALRIYAATSATPREKSEVDLLHYQ